MHTYTHISFTHIISISISLSPSHTHTCKMCRTSQALYVWCQCEEAHVLETCTAPSGSCGDSMAGETVYLQCFCRYHATNGFTSARKDLRLQKKADKKKNKRRSMDSAVSVGSANSSVSSSPSSTSSLSENSRSRLRKSWGHHIRKLSFV